MIIINEIEMDYALEDVHKYLNKEIIITVKGYIENIDLINDFETMSNFKGQTKPILMGQRTKLSILTGNVKIEV